jgi:hypothetical protein
MSDKFNIGDMVEVIKSVLISDGKRDSSVIGRTAMIVDIVREDCPIIRSSSDQPWRSYLLGFERTNEDDTNSVFSSLWFYEGDFKKIHKECTAALKTTPKFKLRDIVAITDITWSDGMKDHMYVGEFGVIMDIVPEALVRTESRPYTESSPYKVAIPRGRCKWWYPETSLELHKSRDEFISMDEYKRYLEGLFKDED